MSRPTAVKTGCKPAWRDGADEAKTMRTARWIFLLIPFAVLGVVVLVEVLSCMAGPTIDKALTPVELNVAAENPAD